MGNEQSEPVGANAAVSPLTKVEVTEVVRDVTAQLAPEELAVFDTVADAWWSDEIRHHGPRRTPGAAVGFGVEAMLLSQLAFPIITGAVGEVLGTVVKDRIRRPRRPASRPATTAAEESAVIDAKTTGERADNDARLTRQQMLNLHAACRRHGVAEGLSPARAEQLADAFLDALPRSPGLG
jgi:hypothetical protein